MERLGWQRGLHYLVEANLENMIQVKAREFNTGTADADGYSGKAMLDSILEDGERSVAVIAHYLSCGWRKSDLLHRNKSTKNHLKKTQKKHKTNTKKKLKITLKNFFFLIFF